MMQGALGEHRQAGKGVERGACVLC
jgi:hypothetical protein